MGDDVAKLDRAQQRLLEAMEHAATVLMSLESGNATQAQETSAKFMEAVEESQVLMLQVAAKQQAPLPYELDASSARLEAAAAALEAAAAARPPAQGPP